MNAETQRASAQSIDAKRKTPVHRRKRSRDLMEELRRRIPDLFDRTGGSYDRVAEELGVPAADVLAETLADTRKRMGIAHSMGVVIPIRRTA